MWSLTFSSLYTETFLYIKYDEIKIEGDFPQLQFILKFRFYLMLFKIRSKAKQIVFSLMKNKSISPNLHCYANYGFVQKNLATNFKRRAEIINLSPIFHNESSDIWNQFDVSSLH